MIGWAVTASPVDATMTTDSVPILSRRPGRAASLATALALVTIAAACAELPTEPTGLVPFSQTDLVVGEGATAENGDVLTVDYTGWLYDAAQPEQKGLIFNSSRGVAPFSFVLGAGQVIDGWDQGLPGMKVGGVRRLVVPPSLAYGQARFGIIPPNATLVFEVTLLEVQ
jgi:FKBP-type peptidyl-prolyl cis-trans isomerase